MEKRDILEQFAMPHDIQTVMPYGSGHINDTFLVTLEDHTRYILQKINTTIFQNADELMENIVAVTSYLKKIIISRGGDPKRETLSIIPTVDDKYYFKDQAGGCYRIYTFVEDAVSYDAVRNPEDFYQSALAFGRFQSLLAEYPAETLHETIPDFHNTPKRFETFLAAVRDDKLGRVKYAKDEIRFVMEREADVHVLWDLQQAGRLPLRVTHNDTKLNNIMIDKETHEGICVIDLDTVMPGLAVNDFGDSIRFGANTAEEDEKDIRLVSLDLNLYGIYVRGFLAGCDKSLTDEERKMLPMGAKIMTLECGIRFLTDYLVGDTYFKIHRKGHNLDRSRTQFALVKDMEDKWEQMQQIVAGY